MASVEKKGIRIDPITKVRPFYFENVLGTSTDPNINIKTSSGNKNARGSSRNIPLQNLRRLPELQNAMTSSGSEYTESAKRSKESLKAGINVPKKIMRRYTNRQRTKNRQQSRKNMLYTNAVLRNEYPELNGMFEIDWNLIDEPNQGNQNTLTNIGKSLINIKATSSENQLIAQSDALNDTNSLGEWQLVLNENTGEYSWISPYYGETHPNIPGDNWHREQNTNTNKYFWINPKKGFIHWNNQGGRRKTRRHPRRN